MPAEYKGETPGIPAPDLAAPGSVSMPYEPKDVLELWKMVYGQDFTSPETQRIAQYLGDFSPGAQPSLERPVSEPEQPMPAQPPDTNWGKRGQPKGGITYTGQATTHDTDGLKGFPAVDLFAKPGTPFLAPEDGTVVRLSGKGGTKGQVYGYSVYFKGKSGKLYFITHLNRKRAPKGRYRQGDQLGTVSAWSGGEPHAHVGVKG